MKTLIVTSQVTFVPRNYEGFLKEVLDGAHQHVAGVFFLKNLEPKLLKTVGGLYVLGAPKIASCLAKNALSLAFDPRQKLCARFGLTTRTISSMNDPEVVEWVKTHNIDLIVNARTRCIYKKEILSAAKLGCLNVHHGLLPENRGTMCDLYALAKGNAAGFSIHVMTEKVDDGRILLLQETSPGTEKDYLKHLHRSAECEGKALATLLNKIHSEQGIPEGMPNLRDNVIYTKTPNTREAIQKLKNAGVIL